MSEKTNALLQRLTQNQFGHIKIGSLLETVSDVVPPAKNLLHINVDRYSQVPAIKSAISDHKVSTDTLQTISEVVPTFPLIVASQLQSQPNLSTIGRLLQIASLGTLIAQYDLQKSHIDFFMKGIDPEKKIYYVASRSQGVAYLPRLVHGDLHLVVKELQWGPTSQRHELIEQYYCMFGLSQLFLRYYFDLLCISETDEIAKHVEDIFENYFTSLSFQETQYWMHYTDSAKLKAQIKAIIEKDGPATRHPILRKHYFDRLVALNPIIHHGGSRKMTMTTNKIFQDQMDAFLTFSSQKMVLLFRTLINTKDLSYPQYLVDQLAKTNPNKLFHLYDSLRVSTIKESTAVAIFKMIEPIINKLPRPKRVFQDEKMLRKKKAQKNIQERASVDSYTSRQLPSYLKNYLEKLHKRVRKKGALTQDQVGAYLSKFAHKSAQITQRSNITLKEKEIYQSSIDETLVAISGENLTEAEKDEYQEEIQVVMSNFESADPEERAHQVTVVGNVLTAAAEMADLKKEANDSTQLYEEALAIKLPIDEDPTHVVTVAKFLSKPIAQHEKLKYLLSHTPNLLSIEMHKIIEKVQLRCRRSSSNPVPIYKEDKLLKRALTRLLFPHHPFSELLQQEIIPVLTESNMTSISVRDFFSFPFAESHRNLTEDNWFDQHLIALEIFKSKGEISEENHKLIEENKENFPILKYSKYYNVFKEKRLDETVFSAVYNLWLNDGLDRLRVQELPDAIPLNAPSPGGTPPSEPSPIEMQPSKTPPN